MDAEAALSVAVALVCAAGIGMAAASVESSIDTTPDEAIDVPSSAVPVGSGQLEAYKQRIQGEKPNANDGPEQSAGSVSKPGGEDVGRTQRPDAGGGSEQEQEQKQNQNQKSASGPNSESSSGPGSGSESGGQPSVLDRLLALLRRLLAVLLSVLPAVVALAGVAAAVYRRDRLAATLSRFRSGDDADVGPGVRAPRPAPTNDVTRAWHEMVDRLGVDRVATKTPRECADAAVAAGADRERVDCVTRAFEEVQYGNAEVTEERRRRVNEALRRIRARHGRRA